MENVLYTVTLTDLGSYTTEVVAKSPEEAEAIAKGLLWDGFAKPAGLKINKRETDADASVAQRQPRLLHSVTAWYRMKCTQMVPATTNEEAITHFRRLLDLNGPFHCLTGEEMMGDVIVEQSSPNGGSPNA